MKQRLRASERLRRAVRAVVPGRAYGALAEALDAGFCVARLGVGGWRALHAARTARAGGRGAIVELRLPTLAHPIRARAGTSDVGELVYTAVRESYGAWLPRGDVRTIVDAGANFGDSSCWYLSRFPRARVIALEPDPANFALLVENSRAYGERARPVEAALWHRPARLALRAAADHDAVSVEEPSAGAGDCEGVSLPQLLERYALERVDLLKCDIEGAERVVFEHGADAWLPRVGAIAVETHGPECLAAVVRATARHGFRRRAHRNLHFFER